MDLPLQACYHALRLVLNGRHFLAPIDCPTYILDVGTGTGIWVMDVAYDHPEAHIVGTDLSPIQPSLVPRNVEFEIDDNEDDWNFSETFDLIHTRFMNGFSIRSWPRFYKQAFEFIKPGGWVENQEPDLCWTSDDGSMPVGGAFATWQQLFELGLKFAGMTARCYPDVMKRQMEEAGFINVKIDSFKMPLGPWAKDERLSDAGTYLHESMQNGVRGISLRVFTNMLGWSVEQLEVLLAEVKAEWGQSKAVHAYVPVYVFITILTAANSLADTWCMARSRLQHNRRHDQSTVR